VKKWRVGSMATGVVATVASQLEKVADAPVAVEAVSPGRVVVAGDWHGNTRWAIHVIEQAAIKLQGEENRLIVHVGDLGIWPGEVGRRYLWTLERILSGFDMRLMFTDGNHEDHPQLLTAQLNLMRLVDPALAPGDPEPLLPVPLNSWTPGGSAIARVFWLPRGCRWEWHGRTWLSMGGAVSPDRDLRVKNGWGWWPEEATTTDQIARAAAEGKAGVVLAHDCPGGVDLALPPVSPSLGWLQSDLMLSEENRQRLQMLADSVEPQHWIHGHYHRAYQKTVQMKHGPVEVTGLHMDGEWLNWLVLDTRTMEWEVPERPG
jgi:hypothetical protein